MPERLKRVLTFRDILIFGIGITIGAGIYGMIGKAASVAGYGVWVSVLIAGVITIFTGLSFAEMTSMFPKTSGYFRLIKNSLESLGGKPWGFLVEWCMIFATIFSITTIAIAFGGYFSSFFSTDIILAAVVLIAIISIVTMVGIKESVNLTMLFTFVEVTGLFVVIVLGLLFVKPNTRVFFNFELGPSVFYAATLMFFAYTGFELIPAQSEETIKPKKMIPKAIIITITVSMIIYTLVALATVNLFDVSLLGSSSAPLFDAVANRFNPDVAMFIGLSAIIATSSTCLGVMVTSSRLLYGLGKERLFPKFFAKLLKRFKTPYLAIIFVGVIAILSALLIRDLETTAELANFLTLLTFYLVNISIIMLRWFKPRIQREFKVPLTVRNTPIPALLGAALCLTMIIQFPILIILNGAFIVAIGLIFYWLTREDGGIL